MRRGLTVRLVGKRGCYGGFRRKGADYGNVCLLTGGRGDILDAGCLKTMKELAPFEFHFIHPPQPKPDLRKPRTITITRPRTDPQEILAIRSDYRKGCLLGGPRGDILGEGA